MKWTHLIAALAMVLASPAFAEKLTFDHRTYPPLEEVLDSGRAEMIRYDDSNLRYVTDRIVTQGTSVDNWTEALDIIVRARGPKMKSATDWASEIRLSVRAPCVSEFTTIAEDAISVTLERRSTGCAAGVAQTALYRIVAGKKSLFMLNVLQVGAMPDAARQQWLTLLASAHIAP